METLIVILLVAILGAVLWSSLKAPQEPKVIYIEQRPEPEPEPAVLPYWTMYGAPSYWPTYLSPYWFYDVPFTGPITGSGGYYRPHGPRHGYSGVAVGGGGGGGGHGGHGGH
jgi:hypothetical protein